MNTSTSSQGNDEYICEKCEDLVVDDQPFGGSEARSKDGIPHLVLSADTAGDKPRDFNPGY